jgi:multicomponent Na+:H+ antiporter subunit E
LVLLVVLWLLAWGNISVANVVSGIAVASLLLLAFPPSRRAGRSFRVSGPGAARFAGYIARQLVTSNIVMIREILRPRLAVLPGVLAHRLQQPSEEIVTVMTSVIALSPGTMTVDVDPDASTIYVHFLFLRDIEAARASLVRLENLTRQAIVVASGSRAPSEKETP